MSREHPTFRVRATGALLVCKCRCVQCVRDGAAPSDHCGNCSIGRHMAAAWRRAHTITAAAADRAAATGVVPDADYSGLGQ